MPSAAPGRASARVLMASLRRLNPHAAWCSIYEFENVVRSVDDVDLMELQPAWQSGFRERLARSVAWRGRHVAFASLNPGLQPARVERDYDLFVFVAMNVWDLLYLNAIRGWRSRCRLKVCYLVEFYAGMAGQYDHFLRLLSGFDAVFLSFSGSVEIVGRTVGKPCHHLPFASDARRFTPFPRPPDRVIDVFSVGRRSEMVHEALRGLAASRGLFYLHDTLPGALVRPNKPEEHRDMLANSAKRARFFVAYPAKFGDDENRGQSEVGARYFEGAAAGAVLLGQAPTATAFRADFPWPDAVIETDAGGLDVGEVLGRLEAAPEALGRMSIRNAQHALRHHDWAHRWRTILQTTGTPPRAALHRRLAALAELADETRPGATT